MIDPENPAANDYLPSQYQPDETLADLGGKLFRETGCLNCHAIADQAAKGLVSKSLAEVDPTRGCMAEQVSAPAVDYELNSVQKLSLTTAIEQRRSAGGKVDDTTAIDFTMVAMNCYACHKRDGKGGPATSQTNLFAGTTPEMGLEGQIPPPLDGVGDKLTDAYMEKLLGNGANERPYMLTRMPKFDYPSLRTMHEAMVRIDRTGDDHPIAVTPKTKDQVTAGRRCVGNRGLACIKCHSFNGEKGGGIGAIDMLKMTSRLRPEWFHRYLLDPPMYRPGTRMPKSFVDGKSPLTDLYQGDPDSQIDAIWKYLSEGTEAKEPEGLRTEAIVLKADAKPIVFRNFFAGVSPRGIAVAYPQELNLIWDAERMSLAKLWKNSFMDASLHWTGRGQGRQQPLGDAVIDVDATVPFAFVDSIDAPWPEESARDLGYQFKGYRLDSDGVPTFRYQFDGVTIEDKPTVRLVDGKPAIERQLRVSGQRETDRLLVWRVAIGSVDGASLQSVELDSRSEKRALIPVANEVRLIQTIQW